MQMPQMYLSSGCLSVFVYHFLLQHLSLNVQAQCFWDNGDFYAIKLEKDHSISMYSLGSLSAEFIYDNETNIIVEVRFTAVSINDL